MQKLLLVGSFLCLLALSAAQCSEEQTAANEGTVDCCYYDSVGIPTIGIGFNLQRSDAADVLSEYAGLSLDAVLADCQDGTQNACLTDDQAYSIFSNVEYPEAASCAQSFVPNLPPTVLAAVTDVAFAGCGTLNEFVQMQAALEQQQWQAAAVQLQDSVWCGQVGNRCNLDYNCIASGQVASPSFQGRAIAKAIKALVGGSPSPQRADCSTAFVHFAVQDALDIVVEPQRAKGFGKSLMAAGFAPVNSTQVLIGDVMVFQRCTGASGLAGLDDGHVQIFGGDAWYSDRKQSSMLPAPSCRAQLPLASLYRFVGGGSPSVHLPTNRPKTQFSPQCEALLAASSGSAV